MKLSRIFLLMSLITISCNHHYQPKIPQGNIDVNDNVLQPQEWEDGLFYPVNDSLQLIFLNNKEQLFIGVDYMRTDSGELRWLEIFFEQGGELYRFHASAKLGEQVFNGQEWNQEWEWGNNKNWTASRYQLGNPQNRGYEFAIQKDRISIPFRFMLTASRIKNIPGLTAPPVHVNYPTGAINTQPETWALIPKK